MSGTERRYTASLNAELGADSQDPTSERFGGKGANLARMAELEVPLLPAIGVSVDAFRHHLEGAGLAERIPELDERLAAREEIERTALPAIRERIVRAALPDDIASELHDAVGSWATDRPGAQIIVRSSATVEDSASHSFAGIFESTPVPEPTDESLEHTVREIWASVFSERAFAYFAHAGLQSVPSMGLILQPFVEADRSGVLFTRFPAPSGGERVLLEHVEGDCAKLVTGEVDPERAWIDRWPGGPSDLGSVEGLEPIAPSAAAELLAVAQRLEDELGAPQDVEWCLDGQALYILQTRPITTTATVPAAPTQEIEAEVLVQGLAASGGGAAGQSHLVFNIDDADALQPGTILVTTMTNPDMVAAMQRSNGVVTDVGGMICHAAIVSRELGIPCIVGTGDATKSIAENIPITVDGSSGVVYDGEHDLDPAPQADELSWNDLWTNFAATVDSEVLPLLTVSSALPAAPAHVRELVLAPYLEIGSDASAHARPIARVSDAELADYFAGLAESAAAAGIERVWIAPLYLDAILGRIEAATAGHEVFSVITIDGADSHNPSARTSDGGEITLALQPSLELQRALAEGVRLAVPLATAGLLQRSIQRREEDSEGGPGGAVFGTPPGSRLGAMPSADTRARWHVRLPEHARALAAAPSEEPGTEHEWLDVRPEVAITPFLSSLVLPGVETIPQALGFEGLPPLHTKWIRCRFHFRKDAFFPLFMGLMQATWQEPFLDRVLERTRASYDALERAAAALPQTEAELRAATSEALRDGFLEWWRAFVDFFASSFFIQAQGDDFVFPEIAGAVDAHAKVAEEHDLFPDHRLPEAPTFTAPTRAVETAEYMAHLGGVWRALDTAGLSDPDAIIASLESGAAPEAVQTAIAEHIEQWGWMRERDPYFAPYDQPSDVVEKALGVQAMDAPDLAGQLAATRLAASVHFELAHVAGDPLRFAYAIGYSRELVLERENHHIAWLKHSYPVRRLWLEWERRLAEVAPLEKRDIFFFKVPEILDAVERLPEAPSESLLERVRNRCNAYRVEMKLVDPAQIVELHREDDYY